jgi:hypothetical protein
MYRSPSVAVYRVAGNMPINLLRVAVAADIGRSGNHTVADIKRRGVGDGVLVVFELMENDEIWRKICIYLNWEFINSFK